MLAVTTEVFVKSLRADRPSEERVEREAGRDACGALVVVQKIFDGLDDGVLVEELNTGVDGEEDQPERVARYGEDEPRHEERDVFRLGAGTFLVAARVVSRRRRALGLLGGRGCRRRVLRKGGCGESGSHQQDR